VDRGSVAIEWYSQNEVRVPERRHSLGELGPGEEPTVCQKVYTSVRKVLLEEREEPEEMVAKQGRLTPRDAEGACGRRNEPEQLLVDRQEVSHIVTVLRRLRAHQAVAVAPFRDKQCIVIAGGPEQCPHTALLVQGDDIAIGKVVGVANRMDERQARALRRRSDCGQEAAVTEQGRWRKFAEIG
jgi:hypothetical protein